MARIEKGPAVVADSGPLIHLDELGVLRLLEDFRRVHVPDAVWEEVNRHRPEALRSLGSILFREGPPQDVDPQLAGLAASFGLARGEAEALQLMAAYPMAVFLTDDGAARLAASRMGYRVHGTLGVLLRGVRRGNLSPADAERLLRSLPEVSTLHLRKDLREEVIAELRKTFPAS